MKKIVAVAVAAASVGALVLGASTTAYAATWAYPGSISCNAYNSTTGSQISASGYTGQTQHRVQGYGGYYYATWGDALFVSTHSKNWGYKDLLSTRVGSLNSGVSIDDAWIACGS